MQVDRIGRGRAHGGLAPVAGRRSPVADRHQRGRRRRRSGLGQLYDSWLGANKPSADFICHKTDFRLRRLKFTSETNLLKFVTQLARLRLHTRARPTVCRPAAHVVAGRGAINKLGAGRASKHPNN